MIKVAGVGERGKRLTHNNSSPNKSEYLFQLKQGSKQVSIFNIPESELKTYELDFVIPAYFGFCHIEREFYCAGGSVDYEPQKEFRKISCIAETVSLKAMPTAKYLFPVTYWERDNSLITLGGSNGSYLD